MTEDELFAELSESVGRHGLGLVVERDPIGRVVVGDADRTWRAIFSPGPIPLRVAFEGAVPTGDERLARGFWSVVGRLTSPADEITALDRARLQRMKDGLGGGLRDRTGGEPPSSGEEPPDEGRVPVR